MDQSGENFYGQAPDSMVGHQEVSISAPELFPDTHGALDLALPYKSNCSLLSNQGPFL